MRIGAGGCSASTGTASTFSSSPASSVIIRVPIGRARMIAPGTTGVSPYAYNGRGRERVSANDGYLEPARERSNLTVHGETLVERVLVENGRARGVSCRRAGELVEFRAAEVILAAGAIHSPAILLRSGIGPAGDLTELGVAMVAGKTIPARSCWCALARTRPLESSRAGTVAAWCGWTSA